MVSEPVQRVADAYTVRGGISAKTRSHFSPCRPIRQDHRADPAVLAERESAVKVLPIFFLLLLCLFLVSCQTCRVTSCEDARYWASQGHETRIAVYRVGIDGKIAGLGRWDYHAQAQALVGDRWLWISWHGLSEHPTYHIDDEIYYWQPSIYEAFLKQKGAYH